MYFFFPIWKNVRFFEKMYHFFTIGKKCTFFLWFEKMYFFENVHFFKFNLLGITFKSKIWFNLANTISPDIYLIILRSLLNKCTFFHMWASASFTDSSSTGATSSEKIVPVQLVSLPPKGLKYLFKLRISQTIKNDGMNTRGQPLSWDYSPLNLVDTLLNLVDTPWSWATPPRPGNVKTYSWTVVLDHRVESEISRI